MKTVTLTIELPIDRIIDLLVSAFEGGSNYWMRIAKEDSKGNPPFYFIEDSVIPGWYAYPFHCDGYLTILDVEDGKELHKLNRAAIERGLSVMREKYPVQFGNWLAENDDADTADVFLQCCLFGEIIYS